MEIKLTKQRADEIKKISKKAGIHRIREMLAKRLNEAYMLIELHETGLPNMLLEINELWIAYHFSYHKKLDEISMEEHSIEINYKDDWLEELRLKFEHNEDDADETRAQDKEDGCIRY